MSTFPSLYLCLFAMMHCAAAQRSYGLCSQVFQMYQYCTSESPDVEKADSDGFANYTEVDEYIRKKFEELEAKIDAKLAPFERFLNASLLKQINEEATTAPPTNPADCRGVARENAKLWNDTGGMFDIYPEFKEDGMEVYCDLTTDGGGWTVFQRRKDGSVDFNRNYNFYVDGFGEMDKEMWLGLENIYQLTKDGEHELRVDMSDWEGNTVYAYYGNFSIGDASDYYRLTAENYSGTARNSLQGHRKMQFSAKDLDVDGGPGHCAKTYKGGWWYGNCFTANLNGIYYKGGRYKNRQTDGVVWYWWKSTNSYSLKTVEMKFRKKN